MAHILIREAEFFRSEQQRARASCQVLANEGSPRLQALERVLEIAMTDRGGSDHKRAVGNRFGHGFEFLGVGEDIGGADGGASILKRHVVRIHYPQMRKAKVTHGASRGTDVEGIARIYQHNTQAIEFSRNRQGNNILRQAQQRVSFVTVSLPLASSSKPFAVTCVCWVWQLSKICQTLRQTLKTA